jgi:hypothetical protein
VKNEGCKNAGNQLKRDIEMENKTILIVANEPVADKDAEFKQWYTEEYIPLMCRFEGIKKVSFYQHAEHNIDTTRYLAVYEFNDKQDFEAFTTSPELADAVKNSEAKWPADVMERQWWASYEIVKTWQR